MGQTWKSLQASYFSRIIFLIFFLFLLEISLCHCEMFDGTTFGLDIGVFIVIAVIFILKIFCKQVYNGFFLKLFKIVIIVILTILKRICFFFKSGKKNCKLSKSKKQNKQHVEKTVSVMVFDFLFPFFYHFHKVKNVFTIYGFFTNPNFF